MTRIRFALAALALAAVAAPAPAAVIVGTVAPAAAYQGTITLAPGVSTSVASWVSDLTAAYNADTGGLWDFDSNQTKDGSAWGGNNNDSDFTLHYGVGGTQSLHITTSIGVNATNMSSAGSTSGQRVAQYSSAAAPVVWTLNAPAGQRVTTVGLTVIPRNGFTSDHDVTYTATLSDASTMALTATIANTNLGYGNGGTFYYFAAPAGLGIDSITYSSAVTTRINPMDDLGFVVAPVPEPASLALLAVGGLALLRRR